MRLRFVRPSAVVLLLSSLTATAGAQSEGERLDSQRAGAIGEVRTLGVAEPIAIKKTLRELPLALTWKIGDSPPNWNPRRVTNPEALLRPAPVFVPQPDPLLERQLRARAELDAAFTTPSVNVAGLDEFGGWPPDTVGEIGSTHYIQAVNGPAGVGTHYQVYDRSTGAAVLAGPVSLQSLAPGGDPCASASGDPVPLFDQLANRWLLTEFDNGPTKHLCLYVSSGADPTTSSWTLYRYDTPELYDYPKYAVWPDAYFGAANANGNPLFAIDRAAVLAGEPASLQVLSHAVLPGFGFQVTPPADLGGPTPPPPGAPGIFIRHRDDEAHDEAATPSTDLLQIFEFTPDFDNVANSTFVGPANLLVSDFESDLCGLTSFECFPQPGTGVGLDPLREVVMNRPVYRNFSSHQSLVGTLVTDVDGGSGDRGGMRWFELRRDSGVASGGWQLHQEGTVSAADTLSRWMGSIAMDGQGNLALGYSTSGASAGQEPSIAYTGRQVTDALGTMSQPETEIMAGTGSQPASVRWGDYSAMSVDPDDDCTFWFTTEYGADDNPPATPLFPRTRIASFAFSGCAAAVGSCSSSDDLALTSADNDTVRDFRARGTVSAGSGFEVGASEVVRFLAGEEIRLDSGTTLGGRFTATLQAGICPP